MQIKKSLSAAASLDYKFPWFPHPPQRLLHLPPNPLHLRGVVSLHPQVHSVQFHELVWDSGGGGGSEGEDQGFPEFVGALVEIGWLDGGKQGWLREGMVWRGLLLGLMMLMRGTSE